MILSFLMATVAVAMSLTLAVNVFYVADHPAPGYEAVAMDLLTEAERDALLGERPLSLPQPVAPPPPLFPARDVRGFVEIAYRITPDGAVGEVQILRAHPAGYFENEAVAVVTGRRFDPQLAGESRTETIEFVLPARADRPR